MSHPPSVSPGITPSRDSWFARVFGGASSDLRHAARLLAKSPGFAAVTLITLALCVGANTAIFSAVYGLMLKPLPFAEPDRVVEIYNTYPKAGGPASRGASNIVQLVDYQQNASSYTHLALWSTYQGMFGEDVSAERLHGVRATADLFEVLGLKPLIGQFFKAENQLPNADKFIVLTQSFWEAHYREDPDVLGKTARLDGETYTIIGIAPRALETFDARVRFLRPMSWDPARGTGSRHGNGPRLLARLKPGVAIGQALAEAETIERRFYDAGTPQVRQFLDRSGHLIRVGRVQEERTAPLKTKLLLLQGGVILVLLIGCVNVANLLLARSNSRQSELAIRCALGATRGVIARQLLLESLLLTGLGAALGLGVARAGVGILNYYRAEMMAQALPFTLDGRMLAFTAVVSVSAALLIGALPIVHILRTNLVAVIHRSSRGASGGAGVRALSSLLIIGQVALALMLLTGAGLLIHSFMKAIAINPGFDPRGVVTGRMAIPLAHRSSDDAGRQLQQRVVQSLREMPGVSSVALGIAVPFLGGLPVNAFTLAEDTLPPGSPQPGANRVVVSPDYFATLKLTLLEGRFLEPGDAAPNAPPVFVVDESFAKKYFAGRSALGGRFSFGGRPQKESDWPTIVGVVRDIPHRGVEDRSDSPYVYHPLAPRNGGLTLFLRTERPAADVITEMRAKLRAIDPAIALFDTGPVQQFIDASFNERRALMLLLGIFAGLALFLSALGIYGVLAYDVSQRTREIGIRGAIGATHGQVVGLIMRQGLWKAAIGLMVGLVGAMLLSGVLKTLLYDLSPTDLRAYAVVSVLLLAVAALASYLPARRAAKINPIEALRAE
jgi:putative ABC transport system permease protein